VLKWMQERAAKARARIFTPTVERVDPAHVTVPAWLVRAAKFASWVATICLVYFLWLYTLDIARDRSGAMHVTHAGTWVGEMRWWFPYVIGFAIISFGVPYVAKIAIPTFMSLSWRGGFWPKLWALIIALAVSLVVIAGTFAVQGDTLMERDREAAVAVEQVQQGRAALTAQIESRRAELTDMMNNRNAYLAQAASVGEAEWQRSYVAQARATRDERLPMIERALGAARAADALRAELAQLRQQSAAAPAVASVQGEVTTERTSWIADTLGWLEGVRAILLSLVMDIVALMMPWIALRLEQARARQMGGVEGSGWAPEGLRIEDLRDQPVGVAQPMTPPRQRRKVYGATGEEEHWVDGHYRKTGRKRKMRDGTLADEMEYSPPPLPDEAGVDGHATGRSVPLPNGEGVMVGDATLASVTDQAENRGQDAQNDDGEPEELSAAELALIETELIEQALIDEPHQGENADDSSAPDSDQPHHERPPETRAERLIAAE
jgi:hypothetical protein